jgi:hypothetical protein
MATCASRCCAPPTPSESCHDPDIGTYAFKAMTTWGDADAYRHFLPRILELTDCGRSGLPGMSFSVIRDKLERARWSDWPQPAHDAIERFLDASFRQNLAADALDRSLVVTLEELSELKRDIAPWLDEWGGDTSLRSLHHLAVSVRDTWQPR